MLVCQGMRPVIYQLFVRHFSNHIRGGQPWGTREQNGCGTFNGINDRALEALARMGVTHVWLTGVIRHATQTPHPGLPADPACIVKGIAGSPYAVTDYYDVDPDLAENPAERMTEFRNLLLRCRRWGMVPMIDFIPNHVSRNYHSRHDHLGSMDNKHVFFSRDNAFYYLEPQGGDTSMSLPDGEFVPERGCGRVTGNNAATWQPSVYDWYETVKLNYGSDYRHGSHAADALPGIMAPASYLPRTWHEMNRILEFWQGVGVGGFRCDMAHLVPLPFWRWVIAESRLRDEGVFFMAEAYNDHMKLCSGDVLPALLSVGFNGVYDSSSYQAVRTMYEGGAWANDLDKYQNPDSPMARGGVRYIENHDEPRIAAPAAWGGVGQRVMPAAMVAQYASTCGPVLIYNGQETAERADGPSGFGGDNGRTSIFDYTSLPRFQDWTNNGAFDGSLLTAELKALRRFTAQLLPLLQHPALSCGSFYGLNWVNRDNPNFGRLPGENTSGHRLYAFLRHHRKSKSTVLVVCNFDPTQELCAGIRIPRHAQEWASMKENLHIFEDLLNPEGALYTVDSADLEEKGVFVRVSPGSALVLEWNNHASHDAEFCD